MHKMTKQKVAKKGMIKRKMISKTTSMGKMPIKNLKIFLLLIALTMTRRFTWMRMNLRPMRR